MSGDVVRDLQKSGTYEIEFSIYAMVDYSGTDGLFWYFKFNGKFVRWIFILIHDDIIKNDFDSCVRSIFFFFQKYVHS